MAALEKDETQQVVSIKVLRKMLQDLAARLLSLSQPAALV